MHMDLLIQDQEIAEEYLYYFPKGRQVKIFERSVRPLRRETGIRAPFSKASTS